jgi:hypothetical protein
MHGAKIKNQQKFIFKLEVQYVYCEVKTKVKQSHYRPRQALRVPGG